MATGAIEASPALRCELVGGGQRVVLAIAGQERADALRDLRILLASQGIAATEVADASHCLEALKPGDVRLVIASWNQPAGNAARLCQAIAGLPEECRAPVMVVGGEFPPEAPYASFEAGASEFLRLPLDPIELLWRLRAFLSSPAPVTERLRAGDLVLDIRNHRVRSAEREVALTPSECAVLRMLMASPGRAVAIEALLVEALGYPPRIGNPEVVRTHIRNLRIKLEADPARPSLLVNLPRVGYLLRL